MPKKSLFVNLGCSAVQRNGRRREEAKGRKGEGAVWGGLSSLPAVGFGKVQSAIRNPAVPVSERPLKAKPPLSFFPISLFPRFRPPETMKNA